MSTLQDDGFSTKEVLLRLEQDFKAASEENRKAHEGIVANIHNVQVSLTKEIGALRNDLTKEIGAVRSDFTKEIGDVRSDFTKEIGDVRNDLTKKIGDVNSKLNWMFGLGVGIFVTAQLLMGWFLSTQETKQNIIAQIAAIFH